MTKKKASKKKATTSAVVVVPTSTGEIVSLEDEFDAYIQTGLAAVSGGGGWPFLSTRGGQFRQGDDTMGDTIRVVLLDAIRTNAYYPNAFDPKAPVQAPACFALDLERDGDMAPPGDWPNPQDVSCKACWANAWGSAKQGNGKACRNAVTMAALLYYDGMVPDEAAGYRVSVPPASLSHFDEYATKLASVGRPLFSVVTTLSLVEGKSGVGHEMKFGLAGTFERETVFEFRDRVDTDAKLAIEAIPQPPAADEAPKAKRVVKKKVAKKKAAKKKAARRSAA